MTRNIITTDFEMSSAAAWKQKIQFELNGADYNDTLLTKTNEGITIKPFYHSDFFEKINIPVTHNNFNICYQLPITNEEETNLKALEVIEKGISAIKFEAKKPFNIAVLFNSLLNKKIVFHFQFRFLSEDFTNQLSAFLKNETVFFNIDIVGNLAKTGNWYTSLNTDFKSIENLIQKNPSANILRVNTSLYQNAGANTVQQVAYALAHANEYFNKFGGEIANNIQFNFATGSQYFFEIAKIRAFRYLLNLILLEYQTKVDAQIFAEPSYRNKTIYNSKINTLRSNSENESAILGGANTIGNAVFESMFNSESSTSLNQLLLLKGNFNLVNLQEITSNCYYIESLTKQIAEKALIIFKEIEKGGGFLNQLKEGTIQRKIVENANKEQDQINKAELILVGTNKYKNEEDRMKDYLKVNPFVERKSHKTLIIPIIPKRLAEKLEQKRLKNEA